MVIGLYKNGGTCLYAIVVSVECLDGLFYILCIDISQKTQTPGIDTQNRNLLASHHAGCTQESTVATQGQRKVGTEVAAIKHMHPLERQLLAVRQEGIKCAFNRHFCLALRETSQYLLDGNRLLGLVGIAEDGKPKFSCISHFLTLLSPLFRK